MAADEDEDAAEAEPALSPKIRRVIEAGAEILEAPPDRIDFLHAVLCQVGMPRRAGAARFFERRSGGAFLRLEAGALFNGEAFVDQPLPYGPKPRLIMAHIASEAVRKRSRHIDVGRSAHAFMMALGVDDNARGYAMLRKQVMALAACRMTLGMARDSHARTINAQPIEQFEAWVGERRGQRIAWPEAITLGETFFNSLLEHAVPLDRRALAALRHSALALDLYSWMAHRLYRIKSRDGVAVPWSALREQFGQEYADQKNFRKEFGQALMQVRAVYPDARLEVEQTGLLLRGSPPPITKS